MKDEDGRPDKSRRIPRATLYLLLTLGILSASLWFFVTLTNHVAGNAPHVTEAMIMRGLRTPGDLSIPVGPHWLKMVCLDITALGSGTVLALVTALVAGYLLLERQFRSAGLVLFATITGAFWSNFLKHIINRDRPQIVPHLAEVSGQSYPSGHSMLSAIVYLTLAVVLIQTASSRSTKIYIVSVAVFITLLVGMTRVYIGVHYPTDVLAGWLAGSIWAVLCWLLASRFQRKETT
ncbi:MAG: phosphatase PAP2 family protein [Chthoniobacterales bacterium]